MFMFTSGINRKMPGSWNLASRSVAARLSRPQCRRLQARSFELQAIPRCQPPDDIRFVVTPYTSADCATQEKKELRPAAGRAQSAEQQSKPLVITATWLSRSLPWARARARGPDPRAGQTGTDSTVKIDMRFHEPLHGHDHL